MTTIPGKVGSAPTTATRGSVMIKGAAGWQELAPGTAGDVITSNGAGADPTYQTPSGGGGGGGETNTASNQGVGGVGLYNSKVGVDLQFRNINAGSSKVTVTLDAPNKEVDIDVSTAALFASPTFTGTPAAPTAAGGTNTTQIATTAFVATSFAPLASPTFTGTPAAPTAAGGTSTTQLATTAFVTSAISTAAGSYQPIDADLTALAASPATAGLVERTGAAAYTTRLIGVANATDIPTRADADARYAPISDLDIGRQFALTAVCPI